MNRFPRPLAPFILTALLAGCTASDTANRPLAPPNSEASTDGYLTKHGTTLELDERARMADPSTLQLLEEKTQELARQKRRAEELEAQLTQRTTEVETLKAEAMARTKEADRLTGLLNVATERERAQTERALQADIDRLKMEQELLRAKLGNLVGENKK